MTPKQIDNMITKLENKIDKEIDKVHKVIDKGHDLSNEIFDLEESILDLRDTFERGTEALAKSKKKSDNPVGRKKTIPMTRKYGFDKLGKVLSLDSPTGKVKPKKKTTPKKRSKK